MLWGPFLRVCLGPINSDTHVTLHNAHKQEINRQTFFAPIDSLFISLVESSYVNMDMYKFELSQKDESRVQLADSSKAFRKPRAFQLCFLRPWRCLCQVRDDTFCLPPK